LERWGVGALKGARGAADVDYQRVISVLDALQQADITKTGLATETSQ
jgi:biopolymer transport protein ExbD